MKFLEHELAEQERGLAGKQEPAQIVAEKSENTVELERKIRELEILIKGLTEELLDLKSVTRKLSSQMEKLGGDPIKSHPETSRFGVRRSEVTAEPIAEPTSSRSTEQLGSRITSPGRRPAVETPAPRMSRPTATPAPAPEPVRAPAPIKPDVPVENLKPGEYEYVMQQDGTIQKRKKTTDHTVIIAGTGYNPSRASHSMAIRAESSSVIEAVDDDDTVEIKR
ncbi:MAG TPA: hypothetical protein O0X66_07960 [Methanocorpusculum sp.]|nr:hypothetical protein [Methanocorpusculum sp.]HJJ50943.1 hypothetical protein [Methanocorpusculum sp.]HJJ54411.1 hypothetical protein [Methanocorpusculum sp.]